MATQTLTRNEKIEHARSRGIKAVSDFDLSDGHTPSRTEIMDAIDFAIMKLELALDVAEATGTAIPEPPPRGPAAAFEQFMQQLQETFDEVGDAVKVTKNVSWVKVEGKSNGHRVYISKGKLAVGRVDSTLPPELVPGAVAPSRYNGRIASWIPPGSEAVAQAIRMLAASRDKVRPLK